MLSEHGAAPGGCATQGEGSMAKWLSCAGVILVGIVLLAAATSGVAASMGGYAVDYRLGETLVFRVVDQALCYCPCQPSLGAVVLGWRMVDCCGHVVHSVTYEAPISATTWVGRWPEVGLAAVKEAAAKVSASGPDGVQGAWREAVDAYTKYWEGVETQVAPGCYSLYVDTSSGTLSRCLWLNDPMGQRFSCGYCPCEQATLQVSCYCGIALQISVEEPPRYRPLSWQTSSCSSGCP